MIKCCSKKNKIWTVPLECLKSRSKLLKFTPNRVNKALFPLNAIEKFRFGSTLAAVKLMILLLTPSPFREKQAHGPQTASGQIDCSAYHLKRAMKEEIQGFV